MNIYLAWLGTILYCLVYPIYFILYYIGYALFLILAPLLNVILFILQPLFLFARLLGNAITAPFYFLARFETIYIYLGVASLTGLAVGLMLHFCYGFLYSKLKLAPDPPLRGPTAKQYRESRRNKAKHETEPLLSPVSLTVSDTPGKGRRGLLAQTIHEEDSDF